MSRDVPETRSAPDATCPIASAERGAGRVVGVHGGDGVVAHGVDGAGDLAQLVAVDVGDRLGHGRDLERQVAPGDRLQPGPQRGGVVLAQRAQAAREPRDRRPHGAEEAEEEVERERHRDREQDTDPRRARRRACRRAPAAARPARAWSRTSARRRWPSSARPVSVSSPGESSPFSVVRAVFSNAVPRPVESAVSVALQRVLGGGERDALIHRVADEREVLRAPGLIGRRRQLGDQRVHQVVGVEVRVEDQVRPVGDLDDEPERAVDGRLVGVEGLLRRSRSWRPSRPRSRS